MNNRVNIIFFTDLVFHNIENLPILNQTIIETFDNLLSDNNLDPKTLDVIYSGYDVDNAFTYYLMVKGFPFKLFDTVGITESPRSIFYRNRFPTYSKMQDYVYSQHGNISEIIWLDGPQYEISIKQSCFNVSEKLMKLSEADKDFLVSAYSLPQIDTDGKNLILLRGGHPTINKLQFLQYHRIMCEIVGFNTANVIVKTHPRYEINAETIRYVFKNAETLHSYYPIELFDVLPSFNVHDIFSTSSTFSFTHYENIISVPRDFLIYCKNFAKAILLSHIINITNPDIINYEQTECSSFYSFIVKNSVIQIPMCCKTNCNQLFVADESLVKLLKSFEKLNKYIIFCDDVIKHYKMLLDPQLSENVVFLRIRLQNSIIDNQYVALITDLKDYDPTFRILLKRSGIKVTVNRISSNNIINIVNRSDIISAQNEYETFKSEKD